MNILVTGGAGYIGSHTCKALHLAGFHPITYDHLEQGHREAVKWGPLEVGSVLDRGRLDEVLKKYQPKAVMHFAAFLDVAESVREPQKYFTNNVEGSRCLVDAIQAHAIPHLVFSSTCATYGIPKNIPITEDHPQNPINPYGESKLQVEALLWDLARKNQLQSVMLRYFNAAGADPAAEIGEDHHPETHLIPIILQNVLHKSGSVKVFGNDYPTPDGSCIRDYIHVSDLADAHVAALKHLQKGARTSAYNLGNGRGFSVLEVIRAAEKVTGKKIPTVIAERRPGDPPILVGDFSRARKDLAWQQKHAELEQIISSAWKWSQQSRNRKQS